MVIYAYREVGGREETLEEHVHVGLMFLDKLYISKGYHHHIARRLDIDEESSKIALKATYALHDLGKAYRPFQDMILKGQGAPGHEVLSAYLTLKCLNLDLSIKGGIAFSILLHHHAMRVIIKAVSKVKNYRSAFTISNEDLEYLSRLYSNLGLKVSLEDKIEPKAIINILDKLTDLFKASPKVWKEYTLAYLLLHPLVTCDIMAATCAALKHKPKNIKDLNTILNKIPPWVKDYIVRYTF